MPDRYGRIFLVSHMRAFTTLAGHVLGSHPEINGYYEMHLRYEDAASLDRQRECFCRHHTLKAGSRYLFDKILHDDYPIEPARLGPVELKLLLSLRPPAPTLASIVELFAAKSGEHPYAEPAGAAAYYRARLATLAQFAERFPGRYVYFDAELWQRAPETLLAWLGGLLGLATPLSNEYQLFPLTGKPGAGDSSPRIASGRIERTARQIPQGLLPADLLAEAEETYASCRARLIRHAARVCLAD
ncbi:MAG: hypothetical protein K6T56_02775 [Burkholderiales bacterium]|nr:hypothetical protein [Burkholderiales bacterium]